MTGHWLATTFFVTEGALRLVIAVHVIYRGRPVAVTLAWLILLTLIPVGSEFMYLLVGENKLAAARLKRYEELGAQVEQATAAVWERRGMAVNDLSDELEAVSRFGTAIGGFPPLHGNRLMLFSDNEQMLQSLVKDIDGASNHVHLLYYIWSNDSGGQRVAEALVRAAKRGVTCRVLVDGVGSWTFIGSSMHRAMEAGGVRVVESLPVNLFRRPLARVDLRNHRKIAVIDGAIGYCGSQNIHDITFRGKRGRKVGQWIDASVRLLGPAVQPLAVTFLQDWHLDCEEEFGDLRRFFPKVMPLEDDCIVQMVPSGPGSTPMAIHQALLTLIYSARQELTMTTPYFVPDDATLAAMVALASRGVRVTLVMPKVSDSLLVAAAGRAQFATLLAAGVHVHLYTKGMLHAKTVVMDRKVGVIGSANMDARSFFLNFESTMFVYDAEFAHTLETMQLGYLRDSIELRGETWAQRPQWKKLRDNVARLFSPLL